MARVATRRAVTRSAASGVTGAERNRALEQMCRILFEFGLSLGATPEDLRKAVATALVNTGRLPYRMAEVEGFEFWHGAGELTAAWYDQVSLTDDDGMPRPLPLSGSRSLESLIAKYLPGYAAAEVVELLVTDGLLIRLPNGLYRPRRRMAVFPGLNTRTLDRMGVLLRALLTTFTWNAVERKGRQTRPERQTHASHLPVESIPEFEAIVKRLATILIDQVDRWMAPRQAPGSRGTRTARVGVSVFSYVERNDGGAQPRRARKRRP
jgi:hypothetical protein